MRHRYPGFTLIEVLIVVVIMAVLAATIIPQFTQSTTDARRSARDFNVHSLRAQIELYKIDHNSTYPPLVGTEITNLLVSTNKAGEQGTAGPDHPYGPYIVGQFPKNPFNDSNAVAETTATAANPPLAPVDATSGWMYNDSTGDIWPNDSDYFTSP